MNDRVIRARFVADVNGYIAGVGRAKDATREFGREVRGYATDVDKVSAKTRDQLDKLGKAGMVMGGVVAVGFGVAIKASMDFDKAMSEVSAVTGATAEEMEKLRQAAIDAGAATSFSATEAASAQAELAKAGISTSDILGGALAGSLDLAAAGSLDLANAAEISAQAMNIFGLRGQDVTHIADVLAAGANKSAADVGQLGDALRQGGLVASQTGLSLEETAGALAAFADNALIGSDAGTSLKTMLQRLTPQSDEAARLMDQLGFSAYDAQGNFIGLEGLAQELTDSLAGMSVEQRNAAMSTMFGSDAIRAANILYTQGAAGMREYVTAVDDQGAAADMAAAKLDNLAGDLEELSGAFETALIGAGSKGNDVLRGLVQTATDVVRGFSAMPEGLQTTTVGLLGMTGAAAGIGGAFLAIAPRLNDAREALDDLAETSPRLAGALGRLPTVARLAGGGLTALTIATTILGKTQADAAENVAEFTENLPDPKTMADRAVRIDELNEKLDMTRNRAWEASGAAERFNREVSKWGQVALPWEDNTIKEAEEEVGVLTDQLREERQALEDLGDNLEVVARRTGLTTEEAEKLASSLGVDLAVGGEAAKQAIDSVVAGFSEMDVTGVPASERMTMSLEEQQAAAEDLAERYATLGESFGGFTDAQTAWDDIVARNQEWAQSVADSTESASDSWQDYYDGFSVSTEEWIAEMQAQVDAQMEWKDNIVRIAAAGRADVAEILADMGPEGAQLAQRFTELTGAEFQRAADLFVRTMSDGGANMGAALDHELKIMAAIGGAGGRQTAEAIAKETGSSVEEVRLIAFSYGMALAEGINPVLKGIGRPGVDFVPGSRRMPKYAEGGSVPGVGDQDTVPALLTPGEFVVRKAAVAALGRDQLERINRADREPVRFYATGGFVSASDVPAPPDVSRYGNMVGYAGGQTMDHLYRAVKEWISTAAVPTASGSATGLDPAFLGMFNRYNQALGGILRIISGFRSRERQSQLYADYLAGRGNLAAPPGRSKHERGLAIDHAPNSTAGMRSVARGFGLHYPVRGEPWHVEPIHVRDRGGPLMPGLTWNGTGRPEVVLPVDPQRFATGGLVGSAVASVTARLGAEAAGRHHAQHMYTGSDLDAVGRAYADLVQQVDEATAWLLLQQGLTADGYADAARQIIDTVREQAEAERDALEQAAEAQAKHMRDMERLRDDAFDTLNDLLDQEQRIQERIVEATAAHHAKLRELDAKLNADRRAAIDERAAQLTEWTSIEERSVVRWGNSVSALTRNVRDQLDQFAEWQRRLGEARQRGVSEDVISMLGLASGPEALGQLRAFASATDAEIAALNEAVERRQAQAGEQATVESMQAFSELGRQLMDMQAQYAAEHEALVEDFLAEQAELTAELAAIGAEQGRSYGAAIEEGIRSQIPAIRAAAEEARRALTAVQEAQEAQAADASAPPAATMPAYALGVSSVPDDGPAFLHRGERVLSPLDNRALVAAVQSRPSVHVTAEVYVDGKRLIDDRIKVVLRDGHTDAVIAGAR